MSLSYQAVGWNRQKKRYDALLIGGVALYLALFIGLGAVLFPTVTAETLIIRGLGTAAFLLLHIILAIGPLCRLNSRFLPLLYNRRHMGVTMFILALGHGTFSIIQFHALGDMNPIVSLLVSNTNYLSLGDFPFQPLGLLALIILFLMAATSHDFWLANLGAPIWKRLHMLVYAAYALVVLHVTLGVLQAETNPVFVGLLAIGMMVVLGLHLVAGLGEVKTDRTVWGTEDSSYLKVCKVADIPENRAYIAHIAGDRVAIFRYDGKISAVSNVCQHQNGPLGEGCIIDGYITCPWHGFQYIPETGASPPPFTEKIPTFNVKIVDGYVYVHPGPNVPGTRAEPAVIPTSNHED